MKLWFWIMKKENFRTGEVQTVQVGIIKADNEEEALNKVWGKFGSDTAFGLEVVEVTGESFTYGIYKSSFNHC